MFTSFERSCAEKKLRALYGRMQLSADPSIVWCQSPWQLIMIPALLPVALSESAIHDAFFRGSISPLQRRYKKIGGSTSAVEMLSPYNYKIWEQLWIRIETVRDLMRWNGRSSNIGSAFIPDESELEQISSSFFRDPVKAILLADLSERVSRGYHNRDSRMNGVHMRTQFFRAINSFCAEELTIYLQELYMGKKSTEPERNLSETLFHSNLQFLVESIQFVALGNQGCAAIFFEDICFVMERPLYMYSDGEGRLHNEDGAAMMFSDGYDIYAVEGTLVHPDMIEAPNWLSVDRIYDETNQEIRRFMLKRYTPEKFIQDSQAQKIAEDEFGELYRKSLPNEQALLFVKVINSTPEPDGSFREYFLRVPAEMKTARQAVAWTFGLMANEYAPMYES